MGRRLFLMAAAIVALMAGGTTGASARSDALFGFNDSSLQRGYSPRAVLPLLDRTGATVHRIDIEWQYAEPRPGEWDWERFDRLYRTLRAGGIRPLAVARSAPRWAQSGLPLTCALGAPDHLCQGPPSSAHLGDWKEFVRRVAQRYPDLAGVEVFNEPNYAANNWLPRADPKHYTAVLRAARAAVKSVHPRMPVVFGGLLNNGDGGENMSAERFLREAYAAGARSAMDAIGIHPYSYLSGRRPADPRSPYHRMLADIRQVRNQAGDSGTPLWITETGYHTGSPGLHGVTPPVQAERLAETVRLALAEPDVHAVVVHSLVDRGTNPDDLEAGFGVVRSDLSPKPALAALAAITGAPRITRLVPGRRRYRSRGRRRPALSVVLSEPAHVAFSIERFVRARRSYRPIRRFERSLAAGSRRVRLPWRRGRRGRRWLRRGSYRVSARATDRTGERSVVRAARFRVVR